jgi:hypothetical protein
MKRFKHPALFFVGLFIYFGSLAYPVFASPEVKTLHAIRLFACGMGCGAALLGFIVTFVKPWRIKGSGAELETNQAEPGSAPDRTGV